MLSNDELEELTNYRAHRYEITKLTSGSYVLFNRGECICAGSGQDVIAAILDGPSHYSTCIDHWTAKGRPSPQGKQLLESLGLVRNAVPAPTFIPRRI